MCKQHIPIKIYENGGSSVVCEKCGAILSEWECKEPKKHPKENKKHEKER